LIGSALFYGFLVTSGLLSMTLLVFSGAFLYASWTVVVVMSSEVASGNVGSVAGLTLGVTVGVGGVAAAIFGAAADALGLTTAFYLAAAFPVAGGLLAFLLPRQIGEIRTVKQH
jgi:FSR family fosmidomycin resistance protein-like MFS transporter